MHIVIEYDSCWQTGFLGDNLNKPIDYSKKHRTNFGSDNGFVQKFIATSKTHGEHSCSITDSTVLGILCRLIGDQRKLFHARQAPNFYFSDFENKISWELIDEKSFTELVYLTNKSDDRCAQSSWLGVIPDDNPWFYSENSKVLWSVLYLDRESLLRFILSNNSHQLNKPDLIDCRPLSLLKRIEAISDIKSEIGEVWKSYNKRLEEKKYFNDKYQKEVDIRNEFLDKNRGKAQGTEKQKYSYMKKIDRFEKNICHWAEEVERLGNEDEWRQTDERLNQVVEILKNELSGRGYWSKGVIYPISLYAAALYLQCSRLIAEGYEFDFATSVRGDVQIQGFSKRGFNGIRDWLNPLSGGRKKAVGTPCKIQKQSGKLQIKINIGLEKAIELKTMIDNAGVSAFYLGKKGLAYLSHIDVR